MRLLGIVLIIVGVLALVYQGLSFVIPKEYVDLGFMSITVYRETKIPVPPIVGVVALVAGIALVMSAPGPVAPPPPDDRAPPE